MTADKLKMEAGLAVESGRRLLAAPEMHRHSDYEIYIQDRGVGAQVIGGVFYQLTSRDVLLLRPNLLHQTIRGPAHTRTEVRFTEAFLRRYFSEELCGRFLGLFRRRRLTLSPESYFRVANAAREIDRMGGGSGGSAGFAMLAELLTALCSQAEGLPPGGLSGSPAQGVAMPPLIGYIHENYRRLDSIAQIADAFHITPSHLCRTFKKQTGVTLVQYINNLKIQRAGDLLGDTGRSVAVIAEECGFHTVMYFSRMFKSIAGLPPSEYRKIVRSRARPDGAEKEEETSGEPAETDGFS